MKRIFAAILPLFASLYCFAATQVPDICLIRKDSVQDTLLMFVFPLEDYFEQTGSREMGGFQSCESPACTRGYQAVWQVERDSFFLYNLQGCNAFMSWCDESSLPSLHEMFGSDCVNNRVFARWTTGNYRAFEGQAVPYLNRQIFTSERLIRIKNGKVRKIKHYLNVKPRRKSFAVEQNTPNFLLMHIRDELNWKALPKREPKQWIADLQFTILKNGKTTVKVRTTGSKSFVTALETELNRVMKKIRWFQYRQLGKNIVVSFRISAEFDSEKQTVDLMK
ncbi:MAG: hypothetical protein LBR81_04905 [Prevotellaceae bacterium]|jgi:hypothetical protein|nr:hypothetical protein [Prevotellaceae bacterium]